MIKNNTAKETSSESQVFDRKTEEGYVQVNTIGIATLLKRQGERPDGLHIVEGERLVDMAASCFVITPDNYIWFIYNNSIEENNLSKNVLIDGENAIGYRAPYNEMLAEMIRELDEEYHYIRNMS